MYQFLENMSDLIDNFFLQAIDYCKDYGFVGLLLIVISSDRSRKLLDMLWEIRSAEKKIKIFEAEAACDTPLAQEVSGVAIKAKEIKSNLYIELYNQHKYWWLPARNARS